jgi:imidazole glycerol-phosphate synthase subunit HisF
MKRARVIPVLLTQNDGLYKTNRFKDPKYVGDPLIAARIFNEKQCDELILLDIEASKKSQPINTKLIEEMASECFMPLAYGGGIKSLQDIEKILRLGIEKVVLNSSILQNPSFVKQAADEFASSTLVASVDIKKNLLGKYQVYSHSGQKIPVANPFEWMKQLEQSGIGEIMLNNVDLDGTQKGYDTFFIEKASNEVSVPVIACGGCSGLDDIKHMFTQTHASAAAAGSMFVFHGKHRAVLISYPDPAEIDRIVISSMNTTN